jgi:Xaa-Pro dipeptidase
MAQSIEALFPAHFNTLLKRYQSLMAEHHYDYAVVPSGMPIRQYLDDMDYPFKPNPHFKALLPLTRHPHCHLVIPQSGKPKVIYYQPVDFWHSVPEDPSGSWTQCVDLVTIAQPGEAIQHLPKEGRIILLGHKEGVLDAISFSAQNPETIVFPLYWHRAYKSEYEVECILQANRIAAKAHLAARDAFYQQESEQGINLAYLKAAGKLESDMPYGNIVALNEHGAILHYTDCRAEVPDQHRAFLIDAGVQVNGYASDITRTYSFDQKHEFNDLIQAMDQLQLDLIDQMAPGRSYVELHIEAHHKIAGLLKQFGFVDMEPEVMVAEGVTSVFFPHGLGHQLGLQVHDVGGHQTNEQGGTTPPPEAHPFLRNTRTMEPQQVLTVEPGLYFIESLLADLRNSEFAKQVNWGKVETFKSFGGIRIEDNVLITADGHRNLTREAFAELA